MTLLAQSGATNPEETDTNYGNIFSFWDRIFGTFTAVARGTDINYGLEGFDDAPTQTCMGLLSLPFRGRSEQSQSRVGGSDVAARTELDQGWLR